jgi:DNA-binding response OmpR family regulator
MTAMSDDSRLPNVVSSDVLDLETFTHTAPILLSDDEPQIVRLYEILMARLHLRTVSIPDSREALDYMLNKPVSLVISDLMKPNLTGLDMLKALRQDTTTSDMPFIIVTATPDYESRTAFNALRGNVYLTKPINNRQFSDVVVELLSAELANEAA